VTVCTKWRGCPFLSFHCFGPFGLRQGNGQNYRFKTRLR
jgi:hypothetical protein